MRSKGNKNRSKGEDSEADLGEEGEVFLEKFLYMHGRSD